MIRRHLDVGAYLMTSVVLSTLGIVLIWQQRNALAFFVWLSGAILLLQGVFLLILIVLKKEGKRTGGRVLVSFVFALILLCFPKLPISAVTLLFACYLLITSIMKGINAYLLHHTRAQGVIREGIGCIFYFVFSLLLAVAPYFFSKDVMLYLGLYCLALGVTYAKDVISVDRRLSWKRRIRITLPVWACALLPKRMLNQVNAYLQQGVPALSDCKKSDRVDLMIYIHATQKGFGMIGHIDLSFRGKVYSYGNYDPTSVRLLEAVGDGVLFVSEESAYLPFCIEHEQNTLFAFGLHLEEALQQRVETALEQLLSQTTPWVPAIVQDPGGVHTDFASQLHLACKSDFYKFKQGCFQKYFVMGSNCVKFVDVILGQLGSDILNLRGFLSPGTYLDYLQLEYSKEHSFVITQRIYPYVEKGDPAHVPSH